MISCIVMLTSEWWTVEIVTLISSYLGGDYAATQAVLINITSIVFQIPLGI